MQKAVQQFSSDCGMAKILVDNEMPIGIFHDFLMKIKGTMVDRMVEAQRQQEEQAAQMLAQTQANEEKPADAAEALPEPQETNLNDIKS